MGMLTEIGGIWMKEKVIELIDLKLKMYPDKKLVRDILTILKKQVQEIPTD